MSQFHVQALLTQLEKSLNFSAGGLRPPAPPLKSAAFAASEMIPCAGWLAVLAGCAGVLADLLAGCWLAGWLLAVWLLAGCWLAACWLAGCWLAGWLCWLAAGWLAAPKKSSNFLFEILFQRSLGTWQ